MRNLLLLFILVQLLPSFAQYSDPYRMAFDGSNYYVTNKGNGSITKIANNGTKSTIITGLHSPNDIFFGSIAGNSVILVLDSNQIKIYDSTTFSTVLSLNITGALEAHDGLFNPNNINEFFISDRSGDKIIKGNIGSAPFYPVTFSTLTSTIAKPTGMIFNSNGEMLVVSDTLNANIYKIDLTSGNKTIELTTNLNYLNDIGQDLQGNYYVSNWGDSKVYRYSKKWKNRYAVSTYNHPSGILVNTTKNVVGVCCTNCQKVEFKSIHLFSPAIDISLCQNDSFTVSFFPSFRGIGTYASNNHFVVEMSDSNGHFFNSKILGSVADSVVPSSIRAHLPLGEYSDSGYLYRIASTSPVKYSFYTKKLDIRPQPEAKFAGGDSFYLCVGTEQLLKTAYVPNTEYSFFPPIGITHIDSTTFRFISNVDSTYNYSFQEQNNSTGCVNVRRFTIDVKSSLDVVNLPDTLTMCDGDSILINESPQPYIYNWSGSAALSSTSDAQPYYFGNTNAQLKVSLSDSSNVCFGGDSIFITVQPVFIVSLQDTATLCKGDSIEIGVASSEQNFNWMGSSDLTNFDSSRTTFFGNSSTAVQVNITDSIGICTVSDSIYIQVNPKPIVHFTTQESSYCIGDTVTLKDYQIDSLLFVYAIDNQDDFINGNWQSDKTGRFTYTITYTNVNTSCFNNFGNAYNVYHKPDSLVISRSTSGEYLEANLYGSLENNNIGWNVNGTFIPKISDTIHTSRFNEGDSIYAYNANFSECDIYSNSIIWKVLSVNLPTIHFDIIPNPSQGNFTINTIGQIKSVRIFDMSGRQVFQAPQHLNSQIQTTGLKGIYIVEVSTNKGKGRSRLIVE